jgi:hypothetical protein
MSDTCELHIAFFPEEYDYVCDSISEANGRSPGENPMNAEYIEKTNTRRTELGLSFLGLGRTARDENPLAWVIGNLTLGKEAEPRDIVTSRAREDADTEREREQARLAVQTPSWLDLRIDEMLVSQRFLYGSQHRADQKLIAFRILGELSEVTPMAESEPNFLRQMRRILPNLSEPEYQGFFEHAQREWMEVYGF